MTEVHSNLKETSPESAEVIARKVITLSVTVAVYVSPSEEEETRAAPGQATVPSATGMAPPSTKQSGSLESGSLNERRAKAFEFAADATKQVITASIGVVAFTAAFAEDIAGAPSTSQTWLLIAAWVIYFVSVVSGFMALYFWTDELEPARMQNAKQDPSIYAGRGWSLAQVVSFLFATSAIIVFSAWSLL